MEAEIVKRVELLRLARLRKDAERDVFAPDGRDGGDAQAHLKAVDCRIDVAVLWGAFFGDV